MGKEQIEGRRIRIDVRWTAEKPYIWSLYHVFVNWCDSFIKMTGFNELTFLKDFNSYHILFHRKWDSSTALTIICNCYHQKHVTKLKRLIQKKFEEGKPKFEKPRVFEIIGKNKGQTK